MDRQDGPQTFRTAMIWLATAAGLFLLWWLRMVALVAFAAVLVALLLRVLAYWICRWTHLREGVGLTLAILVLLLIGGGTVWLFGANISGEFGQLIGRVRNGEQAMSSFLHHRGIDISSLENQGASYLRGMVSGMLSTGLTILEGVVVVAISAIYLAAQPDLYRRGAALLFGRALRDEVEEGLGLIGTSLKLWLLAQLILMLIVGVLSFVATWLLGLPGAVALGLIAGITEMVPYLGPFIGGIPAVLVALTQGLDTALWTIAAYVGIHLVEGYLVAPLLERRFVRIPPALVLAGILAAEAIFGPLGIVVAAPLTAAIFISIKVFYIRDLLHERTEVPEKSPL